MGTRKISAIISPNQTTTIKNQGDSIDYLVTQNGESFGNNNPTDLSIVFNASSSLFGNYSGAATIKWKVVIDVGGTEYNISGDRSQAIKNKADSYGMFDINNYNISGNTKLLAALKTSTIKGIYVYQNGTREIRGLKGSECILTINYEEVIASLSPPGVPQITQNGSTVNFNWTAATLTNSSETIKYVITTDEGERVNSSDITETSYSWACPDAFFGTTIQYRVTAEAAGKEAISGWSSPFLIKYFSNTSVPNFSINRTEYQKVRLSWAKPSHYPSTEDNLEYRYTVSGTGITTVTDAISRDATSIEINLPKIGSDINYKIDATWKGHTISSSQNVNIKNPTLSSPVVITSLSPESGVSTAVNWNSANVADKGIATITYNVGVGPTSTWSDSYWIKDINDGANLLYTFTQEDIINKCGQNYQGTCYIHIRPFWSMKDGSSNHIEVFSPLSSTKAFNYVTRKTVAYFDGTSWKNCEIYYYTGTKWEKCDPYYYDGTSWIACNYS